MIKLLAALSILLKSAEPTAESGNMLQSVLLDQTASLTKKKKKTTAPVFQGHQTYFRLSS